MEYVHIEGVNFDQMFGDTSDISTIRGASRAFEDIVAAFAEALGKTAVITCGASQLTAKTDQRLADMKKGLPNKLKALADVLSFAEGVGGTVEAAVAQARFAALRHWTVPAPIAGTEACALSHRQAAEVQNGVKGQVSRFVKLRRDYGLAYRRELKSVDRRFARDFDELVATQLKLPLSAKGKFAAVYVDGAGFGEALNACLASADTSAPARDAARKKYSNDASSLQSGLVDKALLFATNASGDDLLQIEVLLAGGDDMIFLLPSWKLMSFLSDFGDWTRGATLGEHPVWFRAGCVIASHKTPIRQVVQLASDAVDAMRAAKVSPQAGDIGLYSIDILESAAPPSDDLVSHRRRRFGPSTSGKDFCWPLGRVQGLMTAIDHARRDERNEDGARMRRLPPRSQIYQMLAGIKDLSTSTAAQTVDGRFKSYAAAVQGMNAGRSDAVLAQGFHLDEFGTEVPLPMRLAFLAELWDYTGDVIG